MGLLDDVKPLKPSGRREPKRTEEDNFADLQNLGHEKNSEDFSDSPFADRAPQEEI